MTAALALLVGAFSAAWLMPGLLRGRRLSRRDPVLLIAVWLVSMIGVLLSAAAGVVLLLIPSHTPSTALLATVHECWSSMLHGSPPRFEELAGLLGLTLLAAFVARIAFVFVRSLRRRARKRREHLSVLRLAARADSHCPDTLWLAHDRPLAFSMAGRPGVVVATEGLVRHLSREAVAAVFAHERAHLQGRHHVLIAAADAFRSAMPFLPLFQQAPRALGELIELAADFAAARLCGPVAVRRALMAVSSHGAPSTSLAMAQHSVDTRVARLQNGPAPAGNAHRMLSCAIAGLSTVALPFLIGSGLLMGIALICCPLPLS